MYCTFQTIQTVVFLLNYLCRAGLHCEWFVFACHWLKCSCSL